MKVGRPKDFRGWNKLEKETFRPGGRCDFFPGCRCFRPKDAVGRPNHTVPLGRIAFYRSQAVNCLATLIPSLRDLLT
jgi:hypothetical protein